MELQPVSNITTASDVMMSLDEIDQSESFYSNLRSDNFTSYSCNSISSEII